MSIMISVQGQSQFRHFLGRRADRLLDGDREFRFISFNVPNLHLVEDNMVFTTTHCWRWPDEFEIRDALESVRQMGGTVVRLYTLSVRAADAPAVLPRHVLAPGKFNEDAFRVLDKLMQVANGMGIRIIIPFVDQWSWFGGIAEYAAFRGKVAEAFWTDPQLRSDIQKTIAYLINRKNTFTGTTYREDKALFAWETGNELKNPWEWARDITQFIKSMDPNHLVLDGHHAGTEGTLLPEAIDDPNTDILTTHHYSPDIPNVIEVIDRCRNLTAGKKAYFVGEFGFIPTADVERILDAVIRNGTTGALMWSLRFHNRDGGFYWHSESAGVGKYHAYKAFHWPGFASGEVYDETNLLKLFRRKAFAIRGLNEPPLPKPATPYLLPISRSLEISWRGSAGAESYLLERSARIEGPWSTVADRLDDSFVQYHPLFNDTTAQMGQTYYYRMRAHNAAGSSGFSNTVGPVRVDSRMLVDNMADATRAFSTSQDIVPEFREARKAKEDLHRLKGGPGATIEYRTDGSIRSVKVYAFFPGKQAMLEFGTSPDGKAFRAIDALPEVFFEKSESYGYWKAVLFTIQKIASGQRYLKIAFRSEAQIGRVEIEYGK